MKITKSIGMAVAGFAAVAATPALAATYNLGTLPTTKLSIHHPLKPSNLSDTLTFTISAFGDVGYNLFGRVPNAMVKFFYGPVGSGTPVNVLGTVKQPYFYTLPGNYYAVVSGTPTSQVGYNLRLKYNAAPAPGPAGFLVFGAGAAVLAARKRRAAAKAAA